MLPEGFGLGRGMCQPRADAMGVALITALIQRLPGLAPGSPVRMAPGWPRSAQKQGRSSPTCFCSESRRDKVTWLLMPPPSQDLSSLRLKDGSLGQHFLSLTPRPTPQHMRPFFLHSQEETGPDQPRSLKPLSASGSAQLPEPAATQPCPCPAHTVLERISQGNHWQRCPPTPWGQQSPRSCRNTCSLLLNSSLILISIVL